MELFLEEPFDLGDLVSASTEVLPSPSAMTPSSLGLSGLMNTIPTMMKKKTPRPIETPMMTLILRAETIFIPFLNAILYLFSRILKNSQIWTCLLSSMSLRLAGSGGVLIRMHLLLRLPRLTTAGLLTSSSVSLELG